MSQSYSSAVNLSQDVSGSIISTGIIFMIFAGLSVVARLISRRMTKVKLSTSDYLCVLGLLGAWIETAIAIKQGQLGLGRHVEVVSPANLRKILLGTYIAEIIYSISFTLIKLSILALYQTLLPERSVVIGTYIIGAFVLAWGIAVSFVSIFSCTPIHGFWDFETPSKCVNMLWFFIGNSVPNITADIAILIIPMWKVWPLQMSVKRKVAVIVMFLLGGFVIIASVLRIYFMTKARYTDMTYTFANVGLWTTIEINVAVISASLPTIRPLLRSCWSKLPISRKTSSSDAMPGQSQPEEQRVKMRKRSLWQLSELDDDSEISETAKTFCCDGTDDVYNKEWATGGKQILPLVKVEVSKA